MSEEGFMKCVICKGGKVEETMVQAEIKVGCDRLLVIVNAEACIECHEPYYSTDTLRYFERLRTEFKEGEITHPAVGTVYEIS
jgi:hypothetical protein